MTTQLVDARPEPDFERGHLARAVSLAPDAVLVWAENELRDKTRPLHVYGAHIGDECAHQTQTELKRLGYESVELLPFGYTDRPTDTKTELGPARWEILGCGG